MKTKVLALVAFSLLLLASPCRAQEPEGRKDEKVKTGWNFGGLPVVSFDSDLGFQYGALLNLFHYGDGSTYPLFKHNVYVEWSQFTKGSGINRLFYDTKYLIPGIRFTSDLSYLTDKTYDFYGFNGYETGYNAEWTDDDGSNADYMSRVFYKYDRKMFRFTIDLQGKLPLEKFGWAAGVGLYDYRIGSVDVAKLNEGKNDDEKLPQMRGLYDHFIGAGIIDPDEAKGSFVTYLKAGIVYDTRDNEPNPMSGMWTEAVFTYAPSFMGIGKKFEHVKFSLTHRQYFTLVPDKLSFVYRIGFQTNLLGDCPFYLQPNLTTLILRGATSEGLGGSKSLRGIIRNRVIGNGVAYGNFEMRWKFVRFQFINQNFYLSLNGFVDAGQTLFPVKYDRNSAYWSSLAWEVEEKAFGESSIFSTDLESIHASGGAGLRIVMNQNFIIAIDHGRPFDKRDGKSGTYIGLNFLF